MFAAVHLPTYDWHVPQALLLIGPVRLVRTLAYIKTKSIWTSTLAHVLNDWSTSAECFPGHVVLATVTA